MPRSPRPWFRFYSEATESLKVHDLPDRLVKPWLFCLCLANVNKPRGRLPSTAKVAFSMRVKEEKAKALIAELVNRRFIHYDGAHYVMHEWDEFQADRDIPAGKRGDKSRDSHANDAESPRESHDRVEEEKEKEVEKEKEREEDEEAPARRNIFVLYDNFMGKPALTQQMRELLIEADETYPPQCIEHCFQEAAASSDGRRSWAYVKKILERHEKDGCDDKRQLQPAGRAARHHNDGFDANDLDARIRRLTGD